MIHKNAAEFIKTPHKAFRQNQSANLVGTLFYHQKYIDMNRGLLSLGKLGDGNHFIEIDKDDEGNLYGQSSHWLADRQIL